MSGGLVSTSSSLDNSFVASINSSDNLAFVSRGSMMVNTFSFSAILVKELFSELYGIHFNSFDSVSEFCVTHRSLIKDPFDIPDLFLEHSCMIILDFRLSVLDDLLPLQSSNDSLQMPVNNHALDQLLL